MDFTDRSSDVHSLQTAFRKRFSDGWQLSATYTLSGAWDEVPLPILSYLGCEFPMTAPGVCDVPITLQPDIAGERTLAVGDQRHRAVVNGIWDLGRGLQLSGLYFFGSGERFRTTAGGDRRRQGRGGESRLRADGTIVPRNNFVGNQLHRVDLRLQQRVSLGGVASVDAIFEVFNVLNHKNFSRASRSSGSVSPSEWAPRPEGE